MDAHADAGLRVEDFEIADQQSRARLLMPGIDWTRIRADNEIRPTIGSRLSFELRAAADATRARTRRSCRPSRTESGSGRRRAASAFIVRGQLGATAEREFEELPASVRFFAGGDNSVRGYDVRRRSAPSTPTATSSAARRSRRAASSSSSRCARAGRSRSSSTPATRSSARRSTRRRASASAAAGSRRSGRSASISRCRSRTTRRRVARARHAGARPMRWLKRSAIAVLACSLLVGARGALRPCSGRSAPRAGTTWLVRPARSPARRSASRSSASAARCSTALRLEGVRMRTARDELDIDSLDARLERPGAADAGCSRFDARRRRDARRTAACPASPRAAAARPSCRGRCASRKEASRRCRSRSSSARCCFTSTTFAAPTATAGSSSTDVAGTFGDTALAADATFELEDGIELDVAGEWSGAARRRAPRAAASS